MSTSGADETVFNAKAAVEAEENSVGIIRH